MNDAATRAKRLWDAVHSPREPDAERLRYVTEEMSEKEAREYEAGFGRLAQAREELREDREQFRLTRRIARIAAWEEATHRFFEQTRAEMHRLFDRAISVIQQGEPAMCTTTGGFATSLKGGLATSGKQFAMRITSAPDRRRVRMLIEIEDLGLAGACLTLKSGSFTQTATLARPGRHSTKVKAEFFLTRDEAATAQDAGVQIDFSEG